MRADDDLAMLGKFNRVVDEVQQHLAQARHVAAHPLGHIGVQVGQQLDAFFSGAWGGHVAGFFNRGLQVERLGFQFKLAGLDF